MKTRDGTAQATVEKVTTNKLIDMKRQGHRIACTTCYDAPTAGLLSQAGVDVLLVGDSVGMVKLGYSNTLPVTLDEMVHHTKAVSRGASRPLVVADLPYLTYELDPKDAARAAGRLVKEAGAEAIKLEGGIEVGQAIKECLRVHVPVMGHLGLTPQSVHRLGGYRVQGRKAGEAEKLLTDAKILEGAGVFAIVLECIPAGLAREITRKVSVPTIGIGAGPGTDGQILVLDDLLGFTEKTPPKFVKQYANLREETLKAVGQYLQEVREGTYPGPEHVYAE